MEGEGEGEGRGEGGGKQSLGGIMRQKPCVDGGIKSRACLILYIPSCQYSYIKHQDPCTMTAQKIPEQMLYRVCWLRSKVQKRLKVCFVKTAYQEKHCLKSLFLFKN